MQVADLSSQIDSWTKEVEEITKLVEQWQGAVIYIDADQKDVNNALKDIVRSPNRIFTVWYVCLLTAPNPLYREDNSA